MALINDGCIVAWLFLQVARSSDNRGLNNPRVHSLTQRKITNNVLKELALIVLRCGRKIELSDDAEVFTESLTYGCVDEIDGLIPRGVRVPDVMGFVVEDHHPSM